MPEPKKTLIMKFGGSVLQDSKSFHALAQLILQRQKTRRVLVVVSAMQGETDRLIDLAHSVHPSPPRREYDMLVSVGERVSMSLLAMALHAEGAQAVSFTGSQSGVITTEDHAEAKIISVRPYRLIEALDQDKIVIVAGFQGVSERKEITTLGRGGSDTTAVALGVALNAEVEFYKDVPGICPTDPRKNGITVPYPLLTHKQALDIVLQTGGKVLHPRALLLAEANLLSLCVRSLCVGQGSGTRIETTSSQTVVNRPIYELLPVYCHSA